VRAHRPPMLGVKPEVVARAGREAPNHDTSAADASSVNSDLVQRLIAQNRRQGVDPKGPICSARGFWEERPPWEREA
jgi:hypothetical protein